MRLLLLTSLYLLSLLSFGISSTALAYHDGRFGQSGDGGTTCNACHGGRVPPTVTVTGQQGWTQYQPQTLTIEVKSNAPPSSNMGLMRKVGFGAMLLPTQGQDSRAIRFLSRADGVELASGAEAVHYSPIPFNQDGTLRFMLDANTEAAGRFELYLAVNDVDGDRSNRCSDCTNGGRYDQDDHPTNLVISFEVAPGQAPPQDMGPDMKPTPDMSSPPADMGKPAQDMSMPAQDMASNPSQDMGSPKPTLDMSPAPGMEPGPDMAAGGKQLLDSPSACQLVALPSGATPALWPLLFLALISLRRRLGAR